MNKRVLVITYYWPPTGGSGVQRWVKFSKYLPQFGWTPVIYTPSNPEQIAIDHKMASEIPPQAEIIKRHISEPYTLYHKFTGHKKGEKITTINPINNSKDKTLTQKISLWIRANIFIPDPRIAWKHPSVNFLMKYLKEHPVDVIVTTGPPQSMHLIGRELHRRTGIKWIADFRDPWTKMFYFKHLPLNRFASRAHYRLEQSVLREADYIVAVSPRVQKDFMAMLPSGSSVDKVKLITNGFDPSDFANATQRSSSEAETHNQSADNQSPKISIVHTGILAQEGNPNELWKALGQESNIPFDIKLYGNTDQAVIKSMIEAGLEGKFTDEGYKSHSEINHYQQKADILILPLRKEEELKSVLPGKLFEYIAANVPILGIGPVDSVCAEVLKDTGCGQMFEWDDAEGMINFIKMVNKQLHEVQGGSNSILPRNNKKIESYSRVNLTKEYIKLFEN